MFNLYGVNILVLSPDLTNRFSVYSPSEILLENDLQKVREETLRMDLDLRELLTDEWAHDVEKSRNEYLHRFIRKNPITPHSSSFSIC